MWEAFGKFMGKVIMGDGEGALDVLQDKSGEAPACAICAAKGTHEPHSPACGTHDGGFTCIGHGEDGACVMSRK